ncbi:lck-interacting transmembrane adapter 1 isoform X1 [Myotis myotis]|nr:lck-interacting transmembrane adapter 1 isoform X1 [Myotis myotis]
MGPLVTSAPPAFWVLGCLTLLLWLWVLCTACHRYVPPLPGFHVEPVSVLWPEGVGLQAGPSSPEADTPAPLLCVPGLTTLLPPGSRLRGSQQGCRVPRCQGKCKSDTRLHELHQGPLHRTAPRPASMDLLRLQCLEVSRDTTRPPAAFSHRDLPQTSPTTAAAQPSTGPEATYSNVGLATIPRASLAASPVVWAGAGLTSSCAGDEPEARLVVAEYACIHKFKGTGRGPQGLDQGKAQGTPATQVDTLYSRISRPKRRDPGSALDQPDPKGRVAILTRGRNLDYEALPLRGLNTHSDLENVYESIQEMGAQAGSLQLQLTDQT